MTKVMVTRAIIIAIIAIIFTYSLYPLADYCQVCAISLSVLTLPAGFIAMIIGGGLHNAGKAYYAFGMVLQFWFIWWIYILFTKRRKNRNDR